MNAKEIEQILEETGGDVYYAEMFIHEAKQTAKENGTEIPKHAIDFFYREVERYREKREKRINNKTID